jgi:hypothetical protein
VVDSGGKISSSRVAVLLVASIVVLGVQAGCHKKAQQALADDEGLAQSPENDPAGAKAYVQSFEDNHLWGRAVLVKLPCQNCGTSGQIALLIYPHAHTSEIDPVAIVNGAKGHIIGRIENQDDFDYNGPGEYGLTRGEQDDYLWIGKIKGAAQQPDKVAFAIYRINQGGVTRLAHAGAGIHCAYTVSPTAKPFHRVPAAGEPCPQKPTPIYSYSSDGPLHLASNVLEVVSKALPSTAKAMISSYGDLWFSCSAGCCQANSWSLD